MRTIPDAESDFDAIEQLCQASLYHQSDAPTAYTWTGKYASRGTKQVLPWIANDSLEADEADEDPQAWVAAPLSNHEADASQIAQSDEFSVGVRASALLAWYREDSSSSCMFIRQQLASSQNAEWLAVLTAAADVLQFPESVGIEELGEALVRAAVRLCATRNANAADSARVALRRAGSIVSPQQIDLFLQFLLPSDVDVRLSALKAVVHVLEATPLQEVSISARRRFTRECEELVSAATNPKIFLPGYMSALATEAAILLVLLEAKSARRAMRSICALRREWLSRSVAERLKDIGNFNPAKTLLTQAYIRMIQ